MARDDGQAFSDIEQALKRSAAALREAGIPFLLGGSLASWARGGPLAVVVALAVVDVAGRGDPDPALGVVVVGAPVGGDARAHRSLAYPLGGRG